MTDRELLMKMFLTTLPATIAVLGLAGFMGLHFLFGFWT